MMIYSGTYGVLRGIKDLKHGDALDMPYKGKRLPMTLDCHVPLDGGILDHP